MKAQDKNCTLEKITTLQEKVNTMFIDNYKKIENPEIIKKYDIYKCKNNVQSYYKQFLDYINKDIED